MLEINILLCSQFYQYLFFYLFGIFTIYILDKFLLSKYEPNEKIVVLQEDEKEEIEINKKKI